MIEEPFHEGEIAVQQRTGERDLACRHGAGIGSRITPAALPFLARQRLIAVATTADAGHLWTSVWCGDQSFLDSADGQQLVVNRSLVDASTDDPVLSSLSEGRAVGMLAIEFASGRRLRINGRVANASHDRISVLVDESVTNCPKYIHRRQPHDISPADAASVRSERGTVLDASRRRLIEEADTSFVGSVHPRRGVDVSHRGGPAGFVQILGPTTIRVPDYTGNSMFMTLGNFAVDPRACLAVLDFDRNRIASFSGTVRVHFDTKPVGGGAETGRAWDLSIRQWIEYDLSRTLRWETR